MAASLPPQSSSSDDYFNSYFDLGVHELMLQDRPRTTAYRKFFEEHQALVKGKVVMDVGAGTGILSLFAATAGAKKVYAVEASQVASLCEEIVAENEFESVIEVIHGAVEDISLPEGIRVDIIVSEWMGFYLLHESMLESVLIARDRFLAPDGILAPSRACLYMAPVDLTEHFQDRAEHWSNIYGYDFSPIASTINIQEVAKPLVKVLPQSCIKSEAVKLLDVDLKTMSVKEIRKFSKTCQFSMSEESRIHGFAAWFDVDFDFEGASSKAANINGDASKCPTKTKCSSASDKIDVDCKGDAKTCDSSSKNEDLKSSNGCSKRQKFMPDADNSKATPSVCLSTSPFSPATHWKQTVVFLPRTILVMEGVVLCCKVKLGQALTNKRHYNISLELKDESELANDDNENDDDDDVLELEGENDDGNSSDGGNSDDSCDHPVPCDCGSHRCRLISALVDKYDTEHQELGEEAHLVEAEAEMEAAKEIDTAIEKEGWPLDTSNGTPERQEK